MGEEVLTLPQEGVETCAVAGSVVEAAPVGRTSDEVAPSPHAEQSVGGELRRLVASAVEDGIDRIVRVLEERQALDRFREGQIDRLHAELQHHKADLIGKAVRPVLLSMIRLHDDLGKVLEALAAEEQAQISPERLLKLLEGFREDVELALERHGVAAFRADTDRFDAKRQRVLRTVPTESPEQVGGVAAHLRPGFEQGDQLLEKERVAVFVAGPTKPA